MKSWVSAMLVFAYIASISAQQACLIPYQVGHQWGFINQEHHLAIEPAYDSVSTFVKNVAKVKLKQKYGIINKNGSFILKPKYKKAIIYDFGRKIAVVKRNGKSKVFNEFGKKEKFPLAAALCGNGLPDYRNPRNYSISKNGKIALIYTVVDCNSVNDIQFKKDTTDYIYDAIEIFGEDSFLVRNSTSAWGWIPSELYIKPFAVHDEIITTKGYRLRRGTFHKFRDDDKWGVIDVNGNVIVDPIYIDIEIVSPDFYHLHSLFKVEYTEGAYGYIDSKGHKYFNFSLTKD